MSNIASGRLRHFVRIERQDNVTNSWGETETQWVAFANRWASIEPLSGREMFLAQQAQSEVAVRIIIRHTPDVSYAMRVVYRNTIYDIKAVRSDSSSGIEYMFLDCATGLTDMGPTTAVQRLVAESGELLISESGEYLVLE